MPGPYHALIDIDRDFRRCLSDYNFPLDDPGFKAYWLTESYVTRKYIMAAGNEMTSAEANGVAVVKDFRAKKERKETIDNTDQDAADIAMVEMMKACGIDEETWKQMVDEELHGFLSFDLIRECARWGYKQLEKPEVQDSEKDPVAEAKQKQKKVMLQRIQGMSDSIKAILKTQEKNSENPEEYIIPLHKGTKFHLFSREDVIAFESRSDKSDDSTLKEMELNTRQMSILRKIWEIQTEQIKMQTTIGLDGDVLSRISSEYAQGNAGTGLQKLHNEGVATSMKMWNSLVGLVKDFFEAFVKR